MPRRKEVKTLQKLCFNFVTTNMENPWFKQCVEVASYQLDRRYIISRFHSLRKSSNVLFEINSKYLFLSRAFIAALSLLTKIISILNKCERQKMEYLKLLMVPQLTDLVIPYSDSGQQDGTCSLLLSLTHCPVKTNFKMVCYD